MLIYFQHPRQAEKLAGDLWDEARAVAGKVKRNAVRTALAQTLGHTGFTGLQRNTAGTAFTDLDARQLTEIIAQLNLALSPLLSVGKQGVTIDAGLLDRLEWVVLAHWQRCRMPATQRQAEQAFELQALLEYAARALTADAQPSRTDIDATLLIVQGDDRIHREKLGFNQKHPLETYFGFVRALLDITEARAYVLTGMAWVTQSVAPGREPDREPCVYAAAATPCRTLLWKAEMCTNHGFKPGRLCSGRRGTMLDNLFHPRYQVTVAFREEVRTHYEQRRRYLTAAGVGEVNYRVMLGGEG